jgi:hypothetical protein
MILIVYKRMSHKKHYVNLYYITYNMYIYHIDRYLMQCKRLNLLLKIGIKKHEGIGVVYHITLLYIHYV